MNPGVLAGEPITACLAGPFTLTGRLAAGMLRELAAVPVGGLAVPKGGLAATLTRPPALPLEDLAVAMLRELAAVPAGTFAAAVLLRFAMAGAVGSCCASAEVPEEGWRPACIDKHVEWCMH